MDLQNNGQQNNGLPNVEGMFNQWRLVVWWFRWVIDGKQMIQKIVADRKIFPMTHNFLWEGTWWQSIQSNQMSLQNWWAKSEPHYFPVLKRIFKICLKRMCLRIRHVLLMMCFGISHALPWCFGIKMSCMMCLGIRHVLPWRVLW